MKRLIPFFIAFLNLTFIYAQWQKTNGPYHSNIKAFGKNEARLFAIGESDGVFISADNGMTWSAVNEGLPTSLIVFHTIQIDGTRLYLGTNQGVFFSENEGISWVERNNGLPVNTRINAFLVDGSKVYMGANNGIFQSTDNGANWSSEGMGLPEEASVTAIAKTKANILIGTNSGVYQSADNEMTWIPLENGIPTDTYIYSLAIEGEDIYAGTPEGIYWSSDNGNSWTARNSGLTLPSFGVRLQAIGGHIYAATTTGLYISTDNGSSWGLVLEGASGLNNINKGITAILVNGTDLLAGGNNGISLSQNDGETWVVVNKGLPYNRISTLATNGDLVYAGTDYGLYATADNGENWLQIVNNITSSVQARDSNIYIGSIGGCTYVSSDYGNSWTKGAGFFDNGQQVVAVVGTTVFAKYNAGSRTGGTGFISFDNGLNFTRNEIPYSIFANRDDSTLFAVDNSVLVYNEGSWTPVSSPIGNDTAYALALNNSSIFVGTKGGILKSAYNGSAWIKLEFGSSNAKVTSLVADGSNVYACTSNNSIFSSSDNGSNWTEVTDNFEDTIIAKNPYGVSADQLVINETHIFIAAEQGIWARPLSEIRVINEPDPEAPFLIYPNPSTGQFWVRGEAGTSLEIYNALGAKVLVAASSDAETSIDLSSYPLGVYFVVALSKEVRYTQKVIIQ